MLIRIMQFFGLAKPKRVPPKPIIVQNKNSVDIETVKAIITNRFLVMANYSKNVILPVFNEEITHANKSSKASLKSFKSALVKEQSLVDAASKERLNKNIEQYKSLNAVYQLRLQLQNIWAKSTASQAELLESLQDWCRRAEETGINALHEFVAQIKGYVSQKA